MFNEHKILIIIPAYNEEGKIGRVVRKIKNTEIQCQILVIDDGSTDNTKKEASSFGAKVVSHKKNSGVGTAIYTGLRYGIMHGFEIGVVMSGDDQHEPTELPQVLEPIVCGNHVFVQGSRYMKNGKVINENFFRKSTTIVYSMIFSALTGCKVTDATNGFRSFNFNIFSDPNLNLNQKWLGGYELESYLLYKICKIHRQKYIEVPITIRYHKRGYTKMEPFRDWWRATRPMFLLWSGLRH